MADTLQLIREKREERARLVAQAQGLLDGPEAAKPEIAAKFDEIMAEVDSLKEDIDRRERVLNEEADLKQTIERKAGKEDTSLQAAEDGIFEDSKVFGAFLRLGESGLNAKSRAVLAKYKSNETDQLLNASGLGIYAAQSVGTTTAGGFTVPQDSRFMSIVESALKSFGGMREASFVLQTNNGNALPLPTENNTTQVGELVAENAAVAAALDLVFGQVVLDSYKYSSKPILTSTELLQDSAVDVEELIGRKAGERIARILNQHFTTGTGSGQPNGAVTAAAAGKVGTTGQTVTVIYDDLVDLEHSVDAGYRRAGRFMMADSSLKVIRKLKDSQNRPLWEPDVRVGAPDTILSHPYTINEDMAAMAANAKSILFGDFSKYWIRDVLNFTLLRLVELYALNGQVGFLGFSRHDGDLLDAGTNPIKYYQNSAT